ncbi:uncharacterized protein LOC113852024 [Abrus precatorius]|uniref:Uncharacterized protein LOC113852024 n=1 Tax=Abrus precatorius TaxID=3816 RepID=A0A8B8K347_ABRPR|nr:uncharacterized protein LOC113852024 [Abrus precatorius]
MYIVAYIPSKLVFEEKLRRFCTESPKIQRWIDNISKEKWALSHDNDGRRYGHMTTNLSEAVNKEASSYQVRQYDIARTKFEVEEAFNPITQKGGNKWTVILCTKYCECGRFQAYQFLCSHVIAACASVSIDFWQYVDDVYLVQNIVNAYSSQWSPLGNDGSVLQNNESKLVPDETRIRGKGRPKSTRIRNEMDWVKSQSRHRCSNCCQIGHNVRQCTSTQANDRIDRRILCKHIVLCYLVFSTFS